MVAGEPREVSHMARRRGGFLLLLLLPLCAGPVLTPDGAQAGRARHENPGFELFASPQSNPVAVSPDGTRVYVANTESNTLSVIDAATRVRLADIPVGIDPVAVAVRPDGLEVWVANHVSDSISVVDTAPGSATLHQVVETIQSLDANGVTQFDEPVGIAFASASKAYVALSSRNRVAIVNAPTYTVSGSLTITAQDPRALTVRGGRLYVVAFESGNQSELSVCSAAIAGDPQCSFGFNQLLNAGASPNLPGVPKNVVRDPDVPDRDLFVFDTATDLPVPGSPVTNVGTLLYGVAVAADGRVFVTNTDARNHHLDGNGLAAQPPEGLGLGLADLGNRLFRNRVTRVDCGASCGGPTAFDLEPGPGSAVPTPLATPYGVALSADDSTLLVTAAASSRIAAIDTATMAVVSTLDVGAIPRGIAFRSTAGAGGTAYVLNSVASTLSVVAVGENRSLTPQGAVLLPDRTPADVRLGRIAFESAAGSSSGTFACASCHPDGNVDQLLWVIGAECALGGCDQEEQRATMPVRGLGRTVPLHWDGTLGDPVGGPNGEVGPAGSAPANCTLDGGDEQSCFRQLVDAAQGGVMCDQSDGCAGGGELAPTDRENMARFLQRVGYPPARSRRISDSVTLAARRGFADFFMDQGGNGGGTAETCADTTGGCHALPLGVSTNSPAVGGFEAPTMRGMTDRFLHFSGGFTNAQEVLDTVAGLSQFGVIPWSPANGLDERVVFSAGFVAFQPAYNVFPDDMFQMFEEASAGHSGALGRQVSLTTATTNGARQAATESLLLALEAADDRGGVNLRGWGLRAGAPVTVSFSSGQWDVGPSDTLSHAAFFAEAQTGQLVITVTAQLPPNVGSDASRPPLLFTAGAGTGATGDPPLPVIPTSPTNPNAITLGALDVLAAPRVLVDGANVAATVACVGGAGFDPWCSALEGETLSVDLAALPATGTRLLQVQNPNGSLSPELPICIGAVTGCRQP
jgi:YVTN family beta-propeller protein